jgi:uncharacterized repeat protein (TIGR01451 family)
MPRVRKQTPACGEGYLPEEDEMWMAKSRSLRMSAVVLGTWVVLVWSGRSGPAEAAVPPVASRQIATIVPADNQEGDYFGQEVAIDGDVLVVATQRDDSFVTDSGTIYIFYRNRGGPDNWGEVTEVAPSDTASYVFVRATLSGDTLVASSPNLNSGRGAAWVFQRDHGGADNWGEVATLTASDAADNDYFGDCVALDGDTLVVGALANDDFGSSSGAAYIFERDHGGADNWGEVKKLLPSSGTDGDHFGSSVAVSGDKVAIGGNGVTTGDGVGAGAAWIFDRDEGGSGNWGEARYITPADAFEYQNFGHTVAIRGDLLMVGAGRAASGDILRGSAYLFERDYGGAGNWGERVKLVSPDPADMDRFAYKTRGVAVGVDEVFAASDDNNGSCGGCGAVFLFARDQGGPDAWGVVGKIVPADLASDDDVGKPTVSGNILAMSSFLRQNDSGAAFLFELFEPTGESDLSLSKSDGQSTADPQETLSYTLQVSASGPDDVTNAVVSDVFDPAAFATASVTWNCVPDAGSTAATDCPSSGTGSELASGVEVDLGSGESLSFSVSAQLLASIPDLVVNLATVAPPELLFDPDSSNNSSTDSNTGINSDWGDAPDPPYPSLGANDGARHMLGGGLWLGALADGELDGQPSATAEGDDDDGSDDDDGVELLNHMGPGSKTFVAVDASIAGVLDAWVDFDVSGTWLEGGEQIFNSQALGAGRNILSFQVPQSAVASTATFARFRVSSAGAAAPTSTVSDGEVEDYQYVLGVPAVFCDNFESGTLDSWGTP